MSAFCRYVAIALLMLGMGACTTLPDPAPSDYKLDTTPDHDGEHWIGGE